MGVFNSEECNVNASEIELFKSLDLDDNRKDIHGNAIAVKFKAVEYSIKLGKIPDSTKSMEEVEQELHELIDQELRPSSRVPIINLKYFAKYNEKAGFKVAVDGFHNLKKKGIFIAVYGLNPPGVLYNALDNWGEEEWWQVKNYFFLNFFFKF